jgi:hypothetical protein
LPTAILTACLALLSGQAEEVGRVYAREGATLRAAPSHSARAIRALLEGDELVPVNERSEVDELVASKVPGGWSAFSTTEVDTQRLFVGYLAVTEVSAHGPDEAGRQQILRRAAQTTLQELSARSQHFAAVRAQRDLPALATLMETEISPRLLDAQDLIGELRVLSDPHAAALAKQLAKLSAGFKP